MTDDHEQDPVLDPREDERIRALLAGLGTAPDASALPPEVAARLDETLAGLVAERSEAERSEAERSEAARSEAADAESEAGTVVPLRRRWASRAAAAAAAVIVVGVGGVAAANLGLFNGPESTSDAGGASSTAESLQDSPTSPAAPDSLAGAVPAISAGSFKTDVARLLRGGLTTVDSSSGAKQLQEGATADSRRSAGCAGPRVTDAAQTTPVLYDGRFAVLVVHPPRAGERLVEAWTCTGDRVLDSARVPVGVTDTGQSSPGSSGLATPSPSP